MARRSTVTTEENHLRMQKNHEMVALYEKLRAAVLAVLGDVGTGAVSYYIHWDISGTRRTRQFALLYIQRKKIRIETLVPSGKHRLGEMIPDTHRYTLNYRTDITSEADIEEAKEIIAESYRQIRQLVD